MNGVVLSFVALASVAFAVASTTAIEPPLPLYKCAQDLFGPDARDGIFRGVYQTEFEKSSFRVDDRERTVWLSGDVRRVFAGIGGWKKGVKLKARLTVEGTMSAPGYYGHFGMWERELVVKRVVTARIPSK